MSGNSPDLAGASSLAPSHIGVLGVDLASRSWQDNGAALVRLDLAGPRWEGVELGCISWPDVPLTPRAMADAIDTFARRHGVRAVAIDGPQGWREPGELERNGVGRACEADLSTQGKTGCFGTTYPQTQCGWISFSIEVFDALLARPHVRLANDPGGGDRPPGGGYLLLEVFPTASWGRAGLEKLPGKASMRGHDLTLWVARLAGRFGLPLSPAGCFDHDDLQALVSALSAAALVGGPCRGEAHGRPARWLADAATAHRVEGLIWTCQPVGAPCEDASSSWRMRRAIARRPARASAPPPTPRHSASAATPDPSSEEAIARGVELFERLVALANAGQACGVGYAQFLCHLCGAKTFAGAFGRAYSQGDTARAVQLAKRVTEAAGGRRVCLRGGVAIEAGMDTFIWPTESGHMVAGTHFSASPYNEAQWRAVFPDGRRRLLSV